MEHLLLSILFASLTANLLLLKIITDKNRIITKKEIGLLRYESEVLRLNRNFGQQPRWNTDIEQRIGKKLRQEYEQANDMIDFASRADNPYHGGLISVDGSVKDFMAWLKLQLNIKEG